MQEVPPPSSGPDPKPKQERPLTVKGVVESQLDDAFQLLKGLYHIIPGTVEGYKTAFKFFANDRDMKALAANPMLAWEGTKDAGAAFWGAASEPYKKHGLMTPIMKPFTTAGDVLAANGILSRSAGMAAKIAGGAVKAAPVTSADRLATLAAKMEALPGQLMRKAIDKAVLKTTGFDLAKRREGLAIKREEFGRAAMLEKAEREAMFPHLNGMTDQEADLFFKSIVFGNAPKFGISDDIVNSLPRVKEALRLWDENIKVKYAPELRRRWLLKSDSTAKKFAAEAWGRIDDAAVAEAKALIAQATRKPIYHPALFEKKGWTVDDYIDEMLGVSQKKPGAQVGFLEPYKAKPGSIKDPRVFIPMHIKAFRKVEAQLRFRDRLLQSPDLTGAPAGGKALTGNPPPGDISKKYYEDQVRWEQAKAKFTDPTIKRLLQVEYHRPQGTLKTFLRVYDTVLNLFRKSATTGRLGPVPYINPRYVTGNAVGDAILGTLAGSDWAAAKRLIQRKAMPPEILGGQGMSADLVGAGGKLEKAMDIANAFDRATRAGIVTKEVARRLETTALKFIQSSEPLEAVMKSTATFSDLQVEMQRLSEQVARSSDKVRRLDAVIARQVGRHDALMARGRFNMDRYREIDALRQKVVNLQTTRDAILRDITDDMAKSGALEARIPQLKEQVAIVRHGVDRANAFTGDYIGLDGFEQGVMRRLVPFYSWSKAMTMLAFRLPFLSPVKSFLWHRYAQAMMTMVGDPELPEYMKGHVPVLARENGDLVWLNLKSYSPFAGLRRTEFAGLTIPNLVAIGEQNPFISLAFRFQGGRTIFDRSNIPYGEQMVNVSNGDVVEFTEQGKLRKVIPQTPLVSGIVHMFPVTQYVQDILTPYQVNKYNWAGYPEPVLNPDGTYKYPRELWQRVASIAGVGLQSRSRENLIRMEKARARKAMESFMRSYPRANPEEREMIIRSMQDYRAGDYRKFE